MRGGAGAAANAARIHDYQENSMCRGGDIEQTAAAVGEEPLYEHGGGGKCVSARWLRGTGLTCRGIHAQPIDPCVVSKGAIFRQAICKPRVVLRFAHAHVGRGSEGGVNVTARCEGHADCYQDQCCMRQLRGRRRHGARRACKRLHASILTRARSLRPPPPCGRSSKTSQCDKNQKK